MPNTNQSSCDDPFQAFLKCITGNSASSPISPSDPPTHNPSQPGNINQEPAPSIPMITIGGTSSTQPNPDIVTGNNDVWRNFGKVLKALETGAGVFPPLKVAISELLACTMHIQIAEQNRQEHDQLASDLVNLVQTLQTHLPATKPERMPYSIENVARAIGEQAARIKRQQDRSKLGQVARALEDEVNILDCYRRIQQIFYQLQIDVALSIWDLVHEQRVATHLGNLGAAHDSVFNALLSMRIHRRGCTPNTRVKILKDAIDWTRDPNAPKIYWMNGMAGTGKTTIAYTLSQMLEEAKKLGACFFCSRASPDCRDVNRIVPTIAYQLARYSNPYQNELCEVLSNTPDVAKRDISVQFQKLIAGPLMKVKDAIPDDVVIVIDALDECSDTRGTQLVLDLLFTHATSLPTKFFVASRPEPSITAKVDASQDAYRFVLHLHDVEKAFVQEDIHTYLEDELKSIQPEAHIINRLTVQAGRLFIFAATAVRYIEPHDPAVDHQDRLENVLSTRANSKGASQAYARLDELYSAILTRAIKEVMGNEGEARQLVLRVVISAREQLNLSSVAELAGIENEQKVERALLPLRSVLRVSTDNKVISTLHASFPDFMFDHARSGDLHCDMTEQNAYMATQCFEIMKRSLRFNICNIQTSFERDLEIPDLQARVNKHISSGLAYVSRYWGDHLGGAEFSDALANMLDKFLRHRLLFWMEVLNLKDWIGYGATILLYALNFLPDDSQTDLRAMIKDSRNFITTYAASPASQSTPHIYISGLPQTPSHSRVREIYWPRTKGLFEIQGAAIKNGGDAALATWAVGSPVWTLALSKDGKRIASGSEDGSISVWDANEGIRHVGPLSKHQRDVESVAFSPDGSQIASASGDGTICISNAHTGDTWVGPLTAHTKSINCLSFSPDGAVLASASDDRTIRIWDPLTGAQVGTELTGHEGGVTGVVFTSDGTHLVSCSHHRAIRVWDWKTGVSVNRPFEGHTDYVGCVSLSPDDSLIASGSNDCTVRVWSIEQGKTVVGPLSGHNNRVMSVDFSHDGKRVVSGSGDRTIRVWSSETGNMIHSKLDRSWSSAETRLAGAQ